MTSLQYVKVCFIIVKQVGMLQEGAPLPGPETGLLSNTRK